MNKRILVVEDNPHNMRLMDQLIQDIDEEIELIKAETSCEALGAVKSGHFDLVLMDMSLPGIDGISLTRQIKECLNMKSTPFIVVTAHAMESDEDIFREFFEDYISKPIDEEVFEKTIKKWIGDQDFNE